MGSEILFIKDDNLLRDTGGTVDVGIESFKYIFFFYGFRFGAT